MNPENVPVSKREKRRLISLLPTVVLALLCSACFNAPATTDPLIERVERVRYAADTTNGLFSTGAIRQRIVDEYDSLGNVVFSEYRGADDAVQMRFISTVDDGVRTRTDWRREDGSLALFVLYGYDDDNRVIESLQFGPDSTLRRGFQSRWYDDGLRRERGPVPVDGEAFEPNSFYQLNARGEELELLEFPTIDSMRTLFTYDYPERDDYGNWTLRHTSRDGVPSQVETRRIIYRDAR